MKLRTTARGGIEEAASEIHMLLGPNPLSDALDDVEAHLGPPETIQREGLRAEAWMREALGIPITVDLYAVLARLSRRRRDTSPAAAASRRARGLRAHQRALQVIELARDLGAFDADGRLVCSLEHLSRALYAAGIRSRRGTKLTATAVRRALLRDEILDAKAGEM